jgi:hypothetical protein
MVAVKDFCFFPEKMESDWAFNTIIVKKKEVKNDSFFIVGSLGEHFA